MTREDAERIERVCKERGIDTLCHFTHVENLPDILRCGLIPKSEMPNNKFGIKTYYYNDEERYDGHPNASCLSISFPNYKMFYTYRTKFGAARWCVILFSVDVLWEKGCAFYYKNAADHEVRELKPISLNDAAAFEAMFYEEREGSPIRSKLIPANQTTDPQAEVLVFGRIETDYIIGVVFNDEPLLAEAKVSAKAANLSIDMEMKYPFFSYRDDWATWKKGIW